MRDTKKNTSFSQAKGTVWQLGSVEDFETDLNIDNIKSITYAQAPINQHIISKVIRLIFSPFYHYIKSKKLKTEGLKRIYQTYIKPYSIFRIPMQFMWRSTVHVIYWMRLLFSSPFVLLRTFYRVYLKPYAIFRVPAQWVWRNVFPTLVGALIFFRGDRKFSKQKKLIKLVRYTESNESFTRKLAVSEKVDTPKPLVFPVNDRLYLKSPHESYVFPDVFITELHNAVIHGGTNMVLVDQGVLYHDLIDLKRDFTSEELHGRFKIHPRLQKIRWYLHDREPVFLPEAASFVDACAPNYAHWMTEVLPRIALFCKNEDLLQVPLIINDGLHPNILTSLRVVAGNDREIISLSLSRAINVRVLHQVSVAGYVPFEHRTNKLADHKQGMFSPAALNSLRQKAFAYYDGRAKGVEWPSKIYLRRNSGVRKVTNTPAVELELVKNGFSIIEPETLTFGMQVELFSKAKEIVASSGAALANIVFCQPGARITILISKYEGTSYWYWQNIACATGNVVNYVLGEILDGGRDGIHSDFEVDINDLIMSIT